MESRARSNDRKWREATRYRDIKLIGNIKGFGIRENSKEEGSKIQEPKSRREK